LLKLEVHLIFQIPLWFQRWWQVHSPVNEIIAKEVQEAIRYFSTIKKLTQQKALLPNHLTI
jgi:hypothetical protein